jgi:hypothetical protein
MTNDILNEFEVITIVAVKKVNTSKRLVKLSKLKCCKCGGLSEHFSEGQYFGDWIRSHVCAEKEEE